MVRSCENVGPEFDGAIEKHDESITPQVRLPYTNNGNLTHAVTLNFTRTHYIFSVSACSFHAATWVWEGRKGSVLLFFLFVLRVHTTRQSDLS